MDVVEKLRGVDWAGLGVDLVIVHGSVLWSRRPNDVDLVVFISGNTDVDDAVLRIASVVEERVGLTADIYAVSDPSNTNCFLIWEALKHGRIIY